MGSALAYHRRRESDLWRPTFPSSMHALWKLWKARQLCIAGPLQPLAPRGSGRAFHTNHRLCTGLFEWPLEGVGKWRRYCLPLDLISKIPQFHSSDLENSPTMQIILFKQISTYFHFSCRNDGYYWLLSLSSLHFPLNRRAAFTNPKLSRAPRRNPAAAHPSQPCPHSGCAQRSRKPARAEPKGNQQKFFLWPR